MPVTRTGDQREQPGAYITDGQRLYEVRGARQVTPPWGRPERRVTVENCASGFVTEFRSASIVAKFQLVRVAPAVPDHITRMETTA